MRENQIDTNKKALKIFVVEPQIAYFSFTNLKLEL